MRPKHVINDFQAWNDGRINEEKRLAIEQHLKACADCRAYFEKMSLLLDQMVPASLPRLESDPFLPARIRAISGGEAVTADETEQAAAIAARKRPFGWAGVSALALLIIAGVWMGALVGERLSTLPLASSQSYETDIISSFYDEFKQSGFAGDWETILENGKEESNET
jgi:anti-sigma factor RsiW